MKDMQMAPHVRKTVEEIDGDIVALQTDIQRLTDTRTALVDLYGGETEIPPVPVKAKAPKKMGGGKATAPAAGTVAGKGRGLSGDMMGLINLVRTLPEPITAAALAVASGKELKMCSNALWKMLLDKRWLEKGGRGEFKRTATFPPQTP